MYQKQINIDISQKKITRENEVEWKAQKIFKIEKCNAWIEFVTASRECNGMDVLSPSSPPWAAASDVNGSSSQSSVRRRTRWWDPVRCWGKYRKRAQTLSRRVKFLPFHFSMTICCGSDFVNSICTYLHTIIMFFYQFLFNKSMACKLC